MRYAVRLSCRTTFCRTTFVEYTPRFTVWQYIDKQVLVHRDIVLMRRCRTRAASLSLGALVGSIEFRVAFSQREAILKNLREELPKLYKFIVLDQHIEMISGKWEGVYSWIAANYALDRFGHPKYGSQ